MASESISDSMNLDGKDKNGRTPLMHAVRHADISQIKYLLREKANVNAQDKYGQTALMIAASTLRIRSVELLLGAGAAVDIQDHQGQTALMKASGNCLKYDRSDDVGIEAIARLLAAGANPNAQDATGKTPIMLLVMSLQDKPEQDLETFEDIFSLFCLEDCFAEKATYLSADGSKTLLPGAINPDKRMLPDLNLKDHEGRTAYDIATYLQTRASFHNQEHAEGFEQCASEIQSWHNTLKQDFRTHQKLLARLQQTMELAENVYHSDLLLPALKAQRDLIVNYLKNRWGNTSPLENILLQDDDTSDPCSSSEVFSVFSGNIERSGSRSLYNAEKTSSLPSFQVGTSSDTDSFEQLTSLTRETTATFFGDPQSTASRENLQKRYNTYPYKGFRRF